MPHTPPAGRALPPTVLLAGLCALAAQAQAQAPTPAQAASAAVGTAVPVTVCLPDIAAPPYAYRDPRRPGLFDRLLVDAGRDVGLAVTVRRLPSARCRLGLDSGEIDAMPLPAIPLYLQVLDFPLAAPGQVDVALRMARLQFVLVRRRGEAEDWDGVSLTPPGLTVGVRRGVATLVLRLQALGAALDDKASANEQLLAKLLARRVDLVAMSREEFNALAAAHPELEALPAPLLSTDLHLAAARPLKAAVRERLAAWREQIARLRDSPGYRIGPATAPGS